MARAPVQFKATHPDHGELTVAGVTAFSVEHGLDEDAVRRCLNGKAKAHKGWTFVRLTPRAKRRSDARRPTDAQPVQTEPPAQAKSADRPKPDPNSVEEARKLYRKTVFRLIRQMHDEIQAGNGLTTNYKQAMDALREMGKPLGEDFENLSESRDEANLALAGARALLESGDAIYEARDKEIEALIKQFSDVAALAAEYFRHDAEKHEGPPPDILGDDPKATAERAKKWAGLLRRILALRQSIRDPVPVGVLPAMSHAWASTRLLRYAAYAGRPDTGGKYIWSKPHVKMACDIYLARTGYQPSVVHPEGMLTGGEDYHGGKFNADPWEGAVLGYPPRHGKTDIEQALVELSVCDRPQIQVAYVTANEGIAKEFVNKVRQAFDTKTAKGRRRETLYPGLGLSRRDNNGLAMRVACENEPRSPTLRGAAVMSGRLGANVDLLIGDDLVDPKDAAEPTTREQRRKRWAATFMTRRQGGRSFVLISGYPHHWEDLFWLTLTSARRHVETGGREGLRMRPSVMAVGGPETDPPFKPIFPELYNAAWLKRRYTTIADAAIWSSNFMLRPETESLQLIKRVEFYDAEDPETGTERFLKAARVVVSLDPAAEDKRGSDKVGHVVVAVGAIEDVDADGNLCYRRVIRVIEAQEYHATQIDLADRLAALAKSNLKIDEFVIEKVTALGVGVRDHLEREHGITAVTLIPPGPRSKEQRLHAVKGMLEAASVGIRPVVQFAGKKIDGGHDPETGQQLPDRLVPVDEGMNALVQYITHFRMMSGFHSLDACTQVILYLSPEVGGGPGRVAEQAKKLSADAEAKKRLIEMHKQAPDESAREADVWANMMDGAPL